jgi:hypothetical protein
MTRLVCFFALALCSLAQDYFPLASGNQWLFRSDRFGQTLSIEVGASKTFEGVDYFAVTGLSRPGNARWLRLTADGSLVEYQEEQKRTRPFLSLRAAVGERFETNVDDCNRAASILARDAKLSLPALGDFVNVATVKYTDSICADAGIDHDYFLPNIGLVRRVETSFSGPVIYDLVYASVNGFITLAAPESGFSIATPSPIAEGSRIFTRLTARNGGTSPLQLMFSSTQNFNLELTNASTGETVYNWASDKLFLQATQTVNVHREKNWIVDFAVPQGLSAGTYILEGYLTTTEKSQPYRARVKLEVVSRPTP